MATRAPLAVTPAPRAFNVSFLGPQPSPTMSRLCRPTYWGEKARPRRGPCGSEHAVGSGESPWVSRTWGGTWAAGPVVELPCSAEPLTAHWQESDQEAGRCYVTSACHTRLASPLSTYVPRKVLRQWGVSWRGRSRRSVEAAQARGPCVAGVWKVVPTGIAASGAGIRAVCP